MSNSSRKFINLATCFVVLALACMIAGNAFGRTVKVDCSKNGKLQSTIDGAASGDTIEITGICMENILIRDKALTLMGAANGGPHGITGVTANTDGVRIESSRDTVLKNLVISNPLFGGVRIRYHSTVEMSDCEVSNSFAGAGTGIWVESGSRFIGTRLRLDDNLRGLGAAQQSRAFCFECDLNDNVQWAATATQNSVISLLDSVVTGVRGINAQEQSYIDIDCASHVSPHACSLAPTSIAGQALWQSTVGFYEAGDFHGRVEASDRSKAHLIGARQQSIAGDNGIEDESSLNVGPGATGNSRLMGTTNLNGFSRAQMADASTVLDGSLNCESGSDAWVDPAVDLLTPGFTFNNCEHAP